MDATYLSQLENGHWGIRWARVKRMLRTLDLYLSDLAESTRDTRTDAASRLRALPPSVQRSQCTRRCDHANVRSRRTRR